MSNIAVNIDAIEEYSLKEDIGEDKTIFLLGQLDSLIDSYINDENMYHDYEDLTEPYKVRLNAKMIDVIRFGLKGWKNFKDTQGFDVVFKTEEKTFRKIGKRIVISDESIMRIQTKYILELAVEIMLKNKFSEDDKKK